MNTDIRDTIIDAVWPDYPTLLRCALTCRAWFPRSRFNLFRTCELRSMTQLALFSQTLHESALRPAEIVTELVISPMGAVPPTPFNYLACALLAGHLPQLRKLHIGVDHNRDNATGINMLDLSFRITTYMARHIATFSNLRDLALNNVELTSFMAFARLIAALPNVAALHLCDVFWRRSGIRPEQLLLVKKGWLKLEEITVYGPWKLMPGISVIFVEANPTTMKTIGVGSNVLGIDDCEFKIFLKHLRSYTSLTTLSVSDCSPSFGDTMDMRAVIALLDNLPPMRCLGRFVVDLTHAQYTHRKHIILILKDLANNMHNLPNDSLKHLEVRVSDWAKSAPWWRTEVVSLFSPEVQECGILQVIVIPPLAYQVEGGNMIYEDDKTVPWDDADVSRIVYVTVDSDMEELYFKVRGTPSRAGYHDWWGLMSLASRLADWGKANIATRDSGSR